MPFYVVEQKGVPGKRLVEADKPASALSHVVQGSFTITKVDGRELLDAVMNDKCVVEVAGGPKEPDPEPAADPATDPAPVDPPVDPEPNGDDPAILPGGGRVDLNDPPRVNPDDEPTLNGATVE